MDARGNRAFNRHTGAAYGLIIGIVLGSLLMNIAPIDAGRLPDGVRSALQAIVRAACPGAGRVSLLAVAVAPACGQAAGARLPRAAGSGASAISAR